ncbi:MAG: efflux RND transporter periplasmic adaptor subunit [Gemmataceae bacterium]|nr:efflux RND transporter periplasmic adaptor subunit [Gemmataceae bacterium]
MNDNLDQIHLLERPTPSAPPRPASVQESSAHARQREGWLAWLMGGLPTAIVVLLLGGLAVVGHRTGWTVPKFSEIFSGAAAEDDWCPEHTVPESLCVECNEKLLPKIKPAWCRTHGVHYCVFERPEIAQLKETPAVASADLARAKHALDLKERPANSPRCTIAERRLQFASAEVVDKMGIDIAPAWQGPVVEFITASGEIVYEQPRVAPVATAIAGRVWYVTEQGLQGATVKRGDLLALVDAADVGKAKAELLQAFAQVELKAKVLENLKALEKQQITVPAPRMQEAETAIREAQIRLLGAQQVLVNLGLPVELDDIQGLTPEQLARRIQFLGIPDEIAKRLTSKTTGNLFPILAPRDGVVAVSKVTAGEVVDPSKTMFVVADTSQMWVVLNVRLEDVKYLRVRGVKTRTAGQEVRFRPDGGGPEIRGELIWRSTQLDEKTRTVQVRAEMPNPDGSLLANTFGTGRIVLREEKLAILTPSQALHWEGDCHIVFVRDKNFLEPGAPKVFHVRTVRPGVKQGDSIEIIAGLLPGEVVATKNSGNLRAELLKSRLGEC